MLFEKEGRHLVFLLMSRDFRRPQSLLGKGEQNKYGALSKRSQIRRIPAPLRAPRVIFGSSDSHSG